MKHSQISKRTLMFVAGSFLLAALFVGAGGIMAQTGQDQAVQSGDAAVQGAGMGTAVSVPAGFTVIPPKDMDRSGDQIIQLNNLTIRSVSGSVPGVIYASQDTGGICRVYPTLESSTFLPHPCPLSPSVLYQISVQPETILLLRDRARASIGDFEVGDRVNVYGFLDRGTSYMHALILRDLDKPAVAQFIQLNNLTVLSDPSSDTAPATFRAARRGVEPCVSFVGAPRGITYPCPMGVEVSALKPVAEPANSSEISEVGYEELYRPFREYYEIRVAPGTQLMNLYRQRIGLDSIQVKDHINVYGRYIPGTRSVEAVILRDLSVPPEAIDDEIRIVSPNGGESLVLGETTVINWDIISGIVFTPVCDDTPSVSASACAAPDEHLIISLIDGPSEGGVIATLDWRELRQESYKWHIQNVVVGGDAITTILPGSYRLKIELYDGAVCTGFCVRPETPARLIASDVSDRSFRISAAVSDEDAPVISSIRPSSGPYGTEVTLRGEFARTGNYVYFGGHNAGNDLRSDGDTLTFTVPEYVGVCSHNPYDPPKEPIACIAIAMQLQAGPYAVHVVNADGTSNSVTFDLEGGSGTAPQPQ